MEIIESSLLIMATVVIRARIGAIGLRGYLGCIGLAETREYPCGHGVETVKHIVISCR